MDMGKDSFLHISDLFLIYLETPQITTSIPDLSDGR